MRRKVLEEPSADWLVPFLLLALRDRDSYDHQLEKRLDELGFDGMHPGQIYRTLWHME
jgi:DNA-binding PadR family transcriptional regulator